MDDGDGELSYEGNRKRRCIATEVQCASHRDVIDVISQERCDNDWQYCSSQAQSSTTCSPCRRWFDGSNVLLNHLDDVKDEDVASGHCVTFDELVDRPHLKAVLLTSYGEDEELLQQAFGGLPTVLVMHPDRHQVGPSFQHPWHSLWPSLMVICPRFHFAGSPTAAEPHFGVMHAKLMLLLMDDRLRIVISSANFMPFHYNSITQVFWICDLPAAEIPRLSDSTRDRLSCTENCPPQKTSSFLRDLCHFLDCLLEVPGDCHATEPPNCAKRDDGFGAAAAWNSPEAACRFWQAQLRECHQDAVPAYVHLVPSVPGEHSGPTINQYGHLKLQQVLQPIAPGVPTDVFYQCSSLGLLRRGWVAEFEASLGLGPPSAGKGAGTDASNKAPAMNGEADQPALRLVWPSYLQVVGTGGLTGRASLCIQEATLDDPEFPLDRFCHLHLPPSRSAALCHSKVLVRPRRPAAAGAPPAFALRAADVAWLYVGSHNCSAAAWGQRRASGRVFHIASWELGVVLVPPLAALQDLAAAAVAESPTPESGASCSQPLFSQSTTASECLLGPNLPLPFGIPAAPYSQEAEDDVPLTAMGEVFRKVHWVAPEPWSGARYRQRVYGGALRHASSDSDDDPSSDADAAADRPLAIPAARWAPAGRAWAYLLDAAFTAGFEARFGPRHALFLQEVAPLPVVARHQRRRRWRPTFAFFCSGYALSPTAASLLLDHRAETAALFGGVWCGNVAGSRHAWHAAHHLGVARLPAAVVLHCPAHPDLLLQGPDLDNPSAWQQLVEAHAVSRGRLLELATERQQRRVSSGPVTPWAAVLRHQYRLLLFDCDGTLRHGPQQGLSSAAACFFRALLAPPPGPGDELSTAAATATPPLIGLCTNQGGVGLRHWMASAGFGDPGRYPTAAQVEVGLRAVAQAILENVFQKPQPDEPDDGPTSPGILVLVCYAYRSRRGQWGPTPVHSGGLDKGIAWPPSGVALHASWAQQWRKPEPGMLRTAMGAAGAAPEQTVFVGDEATDRLAAEACGAHFLLARDVFRT